ncbi:hypothetical protein J437_LFUL001683 [Ladona fulva]|uniref:tRNA-dihydrouridine(16/17) synthase [NAD(P)(+)] n=1 Tax=Ladona fulva TaxID=123851 RepID=A0A8K0K2J5_LADFU|nr:hypothetical protein J437_LFUL001683 [Ladona fulva]
MEWWTTKLNSPRFVLAPMVDASELAWRLLARNHGAELTYSPMFHASLFAKDPIYRERAMQTCREDRPFFVQFCANDPDQLVEAGLLVQDECDAIDINLGCPQAIARRGRYGAFLQDDWELIAKMVSVATKALTVPITCKVRVFEDIQRTVEYAKMIEAAGAYAITVHGRTREQKGPATGKASWEHIKAVRSNVQIPVIANGNVECVEDVYMCFQQTGCHAVMTAEGSLHNPAVFHTSATADCNIPADLTEDSSSSETKRRDINEYREALKNLRNDCGKEGDGKVPWPKNWKIGPPPPVWEPGLEYLELASKYPCPFSYIRGHLFKLLHHCLCLPINYDLRTNLAKSSTLDEFKAVVSSLRDRFLPYHTGEKKWEDCDEITEKVLNQDNESRSSPWKWYPPWLCQPYIRPTLDEQSQRLENRKNTVPPGMESLASESQTNNGLKCAFKSCRSCCKMKCNEETLDCEAHRFMVKSKKIRDLKKLKSKDGLLKDVNVASLKEECLTPDKNNTQKSNLTIADKEKSEIGSNVDATDESRQSEAVSENS